MFILCVTKIGKKESLKNGTKGYEESIKNDPKMAKKCHAANQVDAEKSQKSTLEFCNRPLQQQGFQSKLR